MKAYKKRELRFLRPTETGAGAARYSAPHGCRCFIFTQPRPIASQWAGAFCYLASDASKRTRATAISRAKNKRFMACLPFSGLAPRRAQAVTKTKATVQACYSPFSSLGQWLMSYSKSTRNCVLSWEGECRNCVAEISAILEQPRLARWLRTIKPGSGSCGIPGVQEVKTSSHMYLI